MKSCRIRLPRETLRTPDFPLSSTCPKTWARVRSASLPENKGISATQGELMDQVIGPPFLQLVEILPRALLEGGLGGVPRLHPIQGLKEDLERVLIGQVAGERKGRDVGEALVPGAAPGSGQVPSQRPLVG